MVLGDLFSLLIGHHIGMIFIIDPKDKQILKNHLLQYTESFLIGSVSNTGTITIR